MPKRTTSSFGAAARSVLVPGWGQLVTDRTLVGKILVFTTGMLGIVALTIFLFVEPVELAAWVADPQVLLAIVLANLVFAAIRLFSTGYAWRAGGGHRWFAGVLLAAIVGIPHVAIAWVGLETRDSLLKVFPEPAPVAVATTTTTSPATTTTTTVEIDLSPIVTSPGQYAEDVLGVEKTRGWRPFGEERLNVLLLGGDAGPGRSGLRTDTMIVASVDPVSGDAVLVGLPRNFGGVELSDGTDVPVQLLNAVYGWGHRHPERFEGPDPGAAAITDVVQGITGLEIDYYMLVDLTGFADLVDAFGGVRLAVPEKVDGPLYDERTGKYEMIVIEPGDQVLDGGQALAYARARYGSNDYSRMGRQRCILAAMARDADLLKLMGRLSDILEVVESNMSTNMPVELVPELIRLAPRLSGDQMRVVGFDSKWGTGRTRYGAVVPDVERIRAVVRETVENPEAGLEHVATAGAACSAS